MASLNKVLLVGHLGRDPDVRVTAQGDPICNLSLATSERFKDKTGESREVTEWHRVVLYRRLAEVARDHLKKGDLVYLEGSLKTRKWQDKSGQDRYTTEIEGREMKMLGGRKGGDAQATWPAEAPRTVELRQASHLPKNDFGDVLDEEFPF